MKNRMLAAVSSAALVLATAGSASALTYVTQLDWVEAGQVASVGEVTIEEVDAFNVKVTVDLFDPADLIVDTGGHWAFTWNMSDSPNSTVSLTAPLGGDGPFVYQGEGSFTQTGAFGDFKNAFACCGKGAKNGKSAPLIFNVFNGDGLTFAGVGATFNPDGSVKTLGSGNRFASNTSGSAGGFGGGWWFAVDIFDKSADNGKGATYVTAGRDAFCTGVGCTTTTTVPEPTTWGLMLTGFFGAGYMIRRRKYAVA